MRYRRNNSEFGAFVCLAIVAILINLAVLAVACIIVKAIFGL